MLSVMLIVLLGSQWFVPPHIFGKRRGWHSRFQSA
jgi:hypothetical protein